MTYYKACYKKYRINIYEIMFKRQIIAIDKEQMESYPLLT